MTLAETTEMKPVIDMDVLVKEPFRVGSLENESDLSEAVSIIQVGGVVAAQMRGVFGVWFDGFSPQAVETVKEIKGYKPEEDRVFSSMMRSNDFLPLVDKDRLSEEIKPLFADPSILQEILGALCHLRVPILSEVVDSLPKSLVSEKDGVYYMQNLDPYGHELMSNFIASLNKAGISYVAVSSYQKKGKPEITEYDIAHQAVSDSEGLIPLLLTDPARTREDIIGSFAIVDVEQLAIERDGHIPAILIQRIIGVELDITNMEPPEYPQVDFMSLLDMGHSGKTLRESILATVNF